MPKLLSWLFSKHTIIKSSMPFATLPEFPQFKKLELSDKEDIEKITSKYPPYSDFNFVSMWSWDIKGQMQVSQLHGNLVVRFTDYVTGEPFYSFLGDNEANDTTEQLLGLSKKEGLKPQLKLIPEVVINRLKSKFKITEDRDNFDYIYDLRLISKYEGAEFLKKRNKVKFFLKSFPQVFLKEIDIMSYQEKILQLDQKWFEDKIEKNCNFEVKNELLAIEKFFQLGNKKNIIGIGVFEGDALIGYSIFQLLPNEYSISHFTKADIHFKGIYDYIMKEISGMLIKQSYSFLNFEQDLGIVGLKKNKESFTSIFLKKFIIDVVE